MSTKLKFSCYYVHEMEPLRGAPKGKVHRSDRWGTYSDKCTVIVHVDPRDHMLASIEASASLKIEGALGLAYVRKGVWRLKPEAPFGIGCYGQPLVPHRDFAHGHKGAWTWPFGTRLDVEEKPDDLSMRGVLYCADRFGKTATAVKEKQAHRIDCFTGIEHQDVDWLKARVRKPWTGPDSKPSWWKFWKPNLPKRFRRPTYGAQVCLRALGYIGKNGVPLDLDDGWGKNTKFALNGWFETEWAAGELFEDKYKPMNVHPRDPEIYWTLREAARLKCEAENG